MNKNFLFFSRGEKVAIIILLLLIITTICINTFIIRPTARRASVIHNLDSILCARDAALDSVRRLRAAQDSLRKLHYDSIRNARYAKASYRQETSYRKKEEKAETKTKNFVKEIAIIEINIADTAEFATLPGIGPTFARRIVEYRGKLGGFTNTSQLLEVYGLDTARLKQFEKHITIDTAAILKTNVNTSAFRDLLRHPYLDYDDVKKIVNYREKRGIITSWDSLCEIIGRKNENLKPYVEF